MFKRLVTFIFGANPQDPEDHRLSATATAWKQQYYCKECKAKTDHEEFMTEICLSCGSQSESNCRKSRAKRSIWDGSKWIDQYRY